jgi:hypothetical protein
LSFDVPILCGEIASGGGCRLTDEFFSGLRLGARHLGGSE